MLSIPHLHSARPPRTEANPAHDRQLGPALGRTRTPAIPGDTRALAMITQRHPETRLGMRRMMGIAPGPEPLDGTQLPTRRHPRRRSKNCRTLRQFGSTYRGFARAGDTRERRILETLKDVNEHILELERQRLLMQSRIFSSFANARQIAVDKIHEYYDCFRRGYSSSSSMLIHALLDEDVVCPTFSSPAVFAELWRDLSRYHADVSIVTTAIRPEEDDDPEAIVVKVEGISKFRISRDTIKHFFQPVLNDEALVQQVIGKEYFFNFSSCFYFNRDGRVVRLEPRADVAGGLFTLLSDPFSTVRLLRASKLSPEGCFYAYPELEEAQ